MKLSLDYCLRVVMGLLLATSIYFLKSLVEENKTAHERIEDKLAAMSESQAITKQRMEFLFTWQKKIMRDYEKLWRELYLVKTGQEPDKPEG